MDRVTAFYERLEKFQKRLAAFELKVESDWAKLNKSLEDSVVLGNQNKGKGGA